MQRVIFILGECVAPSTELASDSGAHEEPPASLFDAAGLHEQWSPGQDGGDIAVSDLILRAAGTMESIVGPVGSNARPGDAGDWCGPSGRVRVGIIPSVSSSL